MTPKVRIGINGWKPSFRVTKSRFPTAEAWSTNLYIFRTYKFLVTGCVQMQGQKKPQTKTNPHFCCKSLYQLPVVVRAAKCVEMYWTCPVLMIFVLCPVLTLIGHPKRALYSAFVKNLLKYDWPCFLSQ